MEESFKDGITVRMFRQYSLFGSGADILRHGQYSGQRAYCGLSTDSVVLLFTIRCFQTRLQVFLCACPVRFCAFKIDTSYSYSYSYSYSSWYSIV